MSITHTRGNVIIEDIKIGDTQYEYDYGFKIISEVVSLPEFVNDGWSWKNKRSSGEIINYFINPKYAHYGPKLYTADVYPNSKEI